MAKLEPLQVPPPGCTEVMLVDTIIPFLKWVRDLVYYDGPLTSVFAYVMNKEADPETAVKYLCNWCSCDDTHHRWWYNRITDADLAAFAACKLPLRDAMLNSPDGRIILVDVKGHGEWDRAFYTTVDNEKKLDEMGYLSDAGVCLSEDLIPED